MGSGFLRLMLISSVVVMIQTGTGFSATIQGFVRDSGATPASVCGISGAKVMFCSYVKPYVVRDTITRYFLGQYVPRDSCTTDSTGYFHIILPDSLLEHDTISMQTFHYRYLPTSRNVTSGDSDTVITALLRQPTFQLSAKLRSTDSCAPIQYGNAVVKISIKPPTLLGSSLLNRPPFDTTLTLSPEGRLNLDNAIIGNYSIFMEQRGTFIPVSTFFLRGDTSIDIGIRPTVFLSCRVIAADGKSIRGSLNVSHGQNNILRDTTIVVTSSDTATVPSSLADTVQITFQSGSNGYLRAAYSRIFILGDTTITLIIDTIPGPRAELRIHAQHDILPDAPPAKGVPIRLIALNPYLLDTTVISNAEGIARFADIPGGIKYDLTTPENGTPYLSTTGSLTPWETRDITVMFIPDTATFAVSGHVYTSRWNYEPPAIDTIVSEPCAGCTVRISDNGMNRIIITDSSGGFTAQSIPLDSISSGPYITVLSQKQDSICGWLNNETPPTPPSQGFVYRDFAYRQMRLRGGFNDVRMSGQWCYKLRDTVSSGRIRISAATEMMMYPKDDRAGLPILDKIGIRVWITNLPDGANAASFTSDVISCSNDGAALGITAKDGTGRTLAMNPSLTINTSGKYFDALLPCASPTPTATPIPPGSTRVITYFYEWAPGSTPQRSTSVLSFMVNLSGFPDATITLPVRLTGGTTGIARSRSTAAVARSIRFMRTRREIRISGCRDELLDIRITDPAGRIVIHSRTKSRSGTARVAVPGTAGGFYIVNVRSNNGWHNTTRMIVP